MVSKHPLSLPGIYRITRVSDGKVYIGQTKKVSQRFASHRRQLDLGKHRNWPLQEAWALDGPDAFAWDLVCQAIGGHDPETLTYLEVEVLRNYPDHFNLNEPVQAYLGAHASTRAKLSKLRKAMWEDPEFQARVSAAHAARNADPEYRAKHAAAMRAFYDTPESSVIRRQGGAKASQKWAEDAELQEREGARRKELWEDPEHRAKQNASRKAVWEDPDKRARRVAGLQGVWDRMTPEERAARQAKMRAGKKSTPEQRSASLRKGWETRRALAAAAPAPPLDLARWWDERLGPEDDGEVL